MIVESNNFSIKQIAESGQCFRMNKTGDNTYGLVAYGDYLELKQIDKETIELRCTEEEYNEKWKRYFDMRYDYGKIVDEIKSGDDTFLHKAVDFGYGIRMLKQEPFEALISFIISQRKSIPAIKTCIEKICAKYGDRKESKGTVYYSFPTVEVLAHADYDTLGSCGVGYRDEYIVKAAQAVLDGKIDLEKLRKASNLDAVLKLKSLYGVGDKVANCVALFGLHHIEAFPIDVWIQRIIDDIYDGYFDTSKYAGYAGIVQQYMFYYYRSIY